jgi:TBC1 domain family member 2
VQVSVDVPRTAPDVPFFQQEAMQTALRRLLYIWGVRHPASGYVQGVNDLVTPFLAVFLSEQFKSPDMSTWQSSTLSEEQLLNAEADSYWCLCKLVERYVHAQPCYIQFVSSVAGSSVPVTTALNSVVTPCHHSILSN